MEQPALLEVSGLKKYYPIKGGVFGREIGSVKAVDDVSFTIKKGETLGIVGESGCGKSTTGRTILRLTEPTAGEIRFQGQDISQMSAEQMRRLRKHMQIIFQDPFASLNPRQTVGRLLEEPLIVHNDGNGKQRKERVAELLEVVGLHTSHVSRYPHQFSGGQRQRIAIARALALNPQLIIADEAVSALDVSIQSQILNLLQDLQEKFQLTYMFIAHDLSVVKHICDRVGVMYLGRLVELANKTQLYETPLHPYSKALLSAVPHVDPSYRRERIILQGDVPSPANVPLGCAFHTRCPIVMDVCQSIRPELKEHAHGHFVSCHAYS